MDLNLFYSQLARGKILKCFVSDRFVKSESRIENKTEPKSDIDSSQRNKLNSQICLAYMSTNFLKINSIGLNCYLEGDSCLRKHISTEHEFIEAIPYLLSLVDSSKAISHNKKIELTTKINSIREFGFQK